jgi:hypothetical protein
MSDKKERDYSNRGGEHSYDPDEKDLGKNADVRQMPLTPSNERRAIRPV